MGLTILLSLAKWNATWIQGSLKDLLPYKSTTDPLSFHKIAQIAMGIINVHPFAQEFINEVGVVTLIESLYFSFL